MVLTNEIIYLFSNHNIFNYSAVEFFPVDTALSASRVGRRAFELGSCDRVEN